MMSWQMSGSESENSRGSEVEMTLEQRFNIKLLQADELMQGGHVDEAVDGLRLLLQKINLLKQSRKEYDRKMQLICIYNLAAAYQKQWSLDECIPLLEKFIALAKINLQEHLKSSGTLVQSDTPNNKHWFKLKTLLIKAMLQYCAVLSQIGEHKKALRTATDITGQLRTLFRRGLQECSRQIDKKEVVQAKRTNRGGKPGIDKIQFSFSVLLVARDILKELAVIQTYSQVIDSKQTQIEMEQIKSNITYWQNIPQNNVKTLRQSFSGKVQIKKKSDRNLLGIKRGQDWIEEFTIAKVMFMTPVNYLQFSDKDNLIFEFNHRNLMEKVFLLSVAYFSLSIELRFLQETPQRNKSKNQKSQNVQKSKLQRSEIFHLKSIEVVCKHVKQNSAFVNHLVVNYHKHYKNNLLTIQEQNSLAQYSELYEKSMLELNSEHKQSPMENKSGNNLILPGSKRFRKDSIYYEQQPIVSKEQVKEEEPIISFKKPKKKETEERQRQNKLKNSTSLHEDKGNKDKTLRKMGSAKMVALGKYELQQIDKQDKSQSFKQISMRSAKEKSLSRNKYFLKNSVTLKHNKTGSPIKDRNSKHKTLRESADMRKDFLKKKSPDHSRPLDLLKKSGSLHDFGGKGLKDSAHLGASSSTVGIRKKKIG